MSNSVTAGGTHTAIAGTTNVNGAGVTNGGFYVAVDGWTFASKNVGGASGALANSKGHAFATNPQVLLTSGATFWYEATGEEIDVSVASGASAYLVNGLQVALLSNHAVHGLSGIDSAINIGAQIGATTGFDFGLRMSNPGGQWPYVATATLIGIPAPGATNTIAAANGIDFSLVPFSGFFLKSQGFTVDGAGNTVAASYKAGANAGLTCSGTPTASFASTLGIVTHCWGNKMRRFVLLLPLLIASHAWADGPRPIDMTTVLNGADGKPMVDSTKMTADDPRCDHCPPMTLGTVVSMALLVDRKEDAQMDPVAKARRGALGLSVIDNKSAVLTSAQIAEITRLMSVWPPLVLARALPLIDPNLNLAAQ